MKKEKNVKIKENPVMVDTKKVKGIKIENNASDDNEVKTFIIIVVIIAALVGVIYSLTEYFSKDENVDEVVAGEIDYDKTSVGTILTRPYDNYYVMVYNSEDSKAVLYSTILTRYMENNNDKDYLKIYYCDLNNTLNSKYYNVDADGKSNTEAKNVEDFDFGDLTLLKIENGKITKYIEDYEKIKEILE